LTLRSSVASNLVSTDVRIQGETKVAGVDDATGKKEIAP